MKRKTKSFVFSDELKDRLRTARDEIVSECTVCDGGGYIPAEEEGRVYRCDCMIVFKYVKELMKAGVVSDYWQLKLSELEIDAAAKKIVRVYIKNIENAKSRGLGLLLLGPNGIGKTSVMAEIGKDAIVLGYSVRYFTLSSYLNALFNKEYALMEDMERGDFLLIDELDKKQGKFADAVDNFLRRMFSQNKSMILGTNWSEEEVGEKFGQSITSLLRRRCDFLEMEGEDFSERLQDDYIEALTNPFNYWHENILEMAMRREMNVYV